MSTRYPELFTALAAPFEGDDVKARSQAGRQFHYITARTAANRLDDVLGPENWWNSYQVINDNSAICHLTIRLPDGTTITKCDAGGAAGMADAGDDDKSMMSDAFKRAAAMFLVARYLYRDGVPIFGPAPVAAPPPEPEPADTERQRARLQARADISKPIGIMASDLVAKARVDFLTECRAEGHPEPPAADLVSIHQATRHLLKWAVTLSWLPDPGKVDQRECVRLLSELWKVAAPRVRGLIRLELIRYLDEQYDALVTEVRNPDRDDAWEPPDDGAEAEAEAEAAATAHD